MVNRCQIIIKKEIKSYDKKATFIDYARESYYMASYYVDNIRKKKIFRYNQTNQL